MRRRAPVGIIAIAILALPQVILALAQAPPKRVVTLGILRPNAPRDARPSQLTTLEDGMATLGVPDLGQFGFTPSFPKGDAKTVVVTISDAGSRPSRELGKVEVVVGGKAVASKTEPSFLIEVTRVIQPK
jgi:hypothetical protein